MGRKKEANRCVLNPFNCSGHMQLRMHHRRCALWNGPRHVCTCDVRFQTWIAAMDLPLWLQCDECGAAPRGEKQAALVANILAPVEPTK